MADVTALTQAVAQLETDVTTAVEKIKAGPTQAEVDTLTSQVNAADAKLKEA